MKAVIGRRILCRCVCRGACEPWCDARFYDAHLWVVDTASGSGGWGVQGKFSSMSTRSSATACVAAICLGNEDGTPGS